MDGEDRRRWQLARALGEFWSGGSGPSHNELSRVFPRYGVWEDPDVGGSKLDRIERAVQQVSEPQLLPLVSELVEMLNRAGMIEGELADERRTQHLRRALEQFGVGEDGQIAGGPSLGVEPGDLITAPTLRDHIRRIQLALQGDDAELLLGSAKELLESASKLVLTELEQPIPSKFPGLLSAALDCLGLNPKKATGATDEIASDVRRILGGLQQIGMAVNDLRNDYGTGHGRGPSVVKLNIRHARLAAGAATVLATTMIDTFEAPDAPWRRRGGADQAAKSS